MFDLFARTQPGKRYNKMERFKKQNDQHEGTQQSLFEGHTR